jgi:bla regulator protein blaR1
MRTAGFAAIAGLSILVASAQDQSAAVPPAQAAKTKMSFDVVSVKESKPQAPSHLKAEHGRLSANLTLFGYIEFAYDLWPSPEQIDAMFAHVPKWVSTDNFEIDAVAEGDPTKDQMRLMVQALLADRFRMQVHTVSAEAPVLALILEGTGATGPKLRPHSEGTPCDVHPPSQNSRGEEAVGAFPSACEELMAISKPHGVILVACRNTTLGEIAAFLSLAGRLGRPVVDQTRLSGRFDFTLEFTPQSRIPPPPGQDVQADGFAPTTIEDALREQLGLKLKPTKAPLDTLIVDHAERPREN